METLILKKEVMESIKTDPILYGKVAAALAVSPASLPRLIYANDAKLTQASVLQILKKHLGKKQDSDLLTQMQIPVAP